jgi:hypothetical protein
VGKNIKKTRRRRKRRQSWGKKRENKHVKQKYKIK